MRMEMGNVSKRQQPDHRADNMVSLMKLNIQWANLYHWETFYSQ